MKSALIELPEKLSAEITALVEAGFFHDEQELIRRAIEEFVRRHHLALTEHFQMEDIEWVRQLRKERQAKEQGA
jgi:Arc/MetJ-type ribon-helix-helix transcriptional regulator